MTFVGWEWSGLVDINRDPAYGKFVLETELIEPLGEDSMRFVLAELLVGQGYVERRHICQV